MKRVDIFLICLMIVIIVVGYSMVTANADLFMWSAGIADVMIIVFIIMRKWFY
jgi:hypothetical protein